MKVEILEKIGTYEKGDVIEMREDLVLGVFKDKVKVLEKIAETNTEKPLNRLNKNKLMEKVVELGIENITIDNTKADILKAIEEKIAETNTDDDGEENKEEEK